MPGLTSSDTLLVPVDGSELSSQALQAAFNLRNKANVTVLHVPNEGDVQVAPQLKPAYIREMSEGTLTGNVPTGRWRYETYKRANGDARGTKEILSSYANDEKVALVVIGQHGVTNKVMIGSSSEFMVRQAIASVVVTVLGADNKSRDGGNKFVVAVDGSINSDHAVAECLRLATVDDTVQIVHIATPGSDELQTAFQPNAIVDKYTTDTKQAKNVSVVKVDVNHRNIAQALVDFAEEQKAHYLVVGADGMRAFIEQQKFIGSVSDGVLHAAKAVNVMVTQVNSISN